MIFRTAVSVLLALAACTAVADDAPSFNLEQFMQTLAANRPTPVQFREERRLAAIDAPVVTRGTLAYTPPGRLERETRQPHNERYVLDGDTFSIERSVEGRRVRSEFPLVRFPPLRAYLIAIRATLAGDRATLEGFYDAVLTGTAESWTLRLHPRQDRLGTGMREIRLHGRAAAIERIDADETGGDTTRMILTPLEPSPGG